MFYVNNFLCMLGVFLVGFLWAGIMVPGYENPWAPYLAAVGGIILAVGLFFNACIFGG